MKRILVALMAIIAALCCAFGIAACGGSGDNSGNSSGNSGTGNGGGGGSIGGNSGCSHRMRYFPEKDASCTEDGYSEYYACSKCGKYFTDENGRFEISEDKLFWRRNHELTLVDAASATCKAEGHTAYYECDMCHNWFSDEDGKNQIIDKTGVVIGKTDHSITFVDEEASTCKIWGHDAYYACTVCEKWFADETGNTEITDKKSVQKDKLPHHFEFSHCTQCGINEPTAGLAYTDKGDHCEVSGIGITSNRNIYVADEYNGKPVTAVASYAFKNVDLEGVDLPDTIISIGSQAFYGCTGLSYINIPKGVISIGSLAFRNCSSLRNIDVVNLEKWCAISFGDEYANPLYYAHTIRLDKEAVKELVIPDSVTSIGQYAFIGCSEITKITLPESVTSIGGGAFSDCTGLKEINLPDGITAIYNILFRNCAALESITIPANVKYIGQSSFYGCASLTGISIPANVSSVGDFAFSGCGNLEGITVAAGNTKYHSKDNCLIETASKKLLAGCKNSVIPTDGSVISIGDGAFYNCVSLTSISIPDCVTSICTSAFKDCTSLETLTVPDGIINIGISVFDGCDNLKNVTLPTWVLTFISKNHLENVVFTSGEYIDAELFLNSKTLLSVTLPNTVVYIRDGAFNGCSNLESINIPDSVIYIGTNAFRDCARLNNITLPDGLTVINEYSFFGCAHLQSIIIPEKVTTIGQAAFGGCTSLQYLALSENLTAIGQNAFENCANLRNVTIPDGVTHIGDGAFNGCSSLTNVKIPDGVNFLGVEAFGGCTGLIQADGGLQYVGKWLVDCGESLTEATIRNDTIGIASYAFYNCRALESLTIPDSVKYIGYHAFMNCNKVRETENGIEYVGKWVVDYDANPSQVTLRNDTVGIAGSAFYNCDMTGITIPDSLKYIGWDAFAYCNNLTSITIPASVEYIGDMAFYVCESLTSVIILADIQYIGNEAFASCGSLTSITIPGSVTYIGDSAFVGCGGLESIIIPESVTRIGNTAFTMCFGLTDITYSGTKAQWEEIEKGYQWDMGLGMFTDSQYTVHCKDGNLIYSPF